MRARLAGLGAQSVVGFHRLAAGWLTCWTVGWGPQVAERLRPRPVSYWMNTGHPLCTHDLRPCGV